MDRVKQLEEIHREALKLFKRKNKDYGDAFADFDYCTCRLTTN